MSDEEAVDLFANEYLIDLNATRAYTSVFPNDNYNSARVIACQYLAKPNVNARVKQLIEERKDKLLIPQSFVLMGLIETANRCQQAAPVMIYDPVEKCMVQARDESGAGVWQFDAQGANKAHELIGRHLGVFEKDNKQKQSDAVDPNIIASIAAKLNGSTSG